METLQILQEHLLTTFEALGKFFRHFPGTLQYSLDTHKDTQVLWIHFRKIANTYL